MAQDGGKVVSPMHQLPLPPGNARVDPRAIVCSKGFYVNEKSNDTSWDRTSDLPICSTAIGLQYVISYIISYVEQWTLYQAGEGSSNALDLCLGGAELNLGRNINHPHGFYFCALHRYVLEDARIFLWFGCDWFKIFCLTCWLYHNTHEREPLMLVFTLYALWKQYTRFLLSVSKCPEIWMLTYVITLCKQVYLFHPSGLNSNLKHKGKQSSLCYYFKVRKHR